MPPTFVPAGPTGPEPLAARLAALSALFLLGCGTAPIEAVVSDEVAVPAGGSGSTPNDTSCSEPAAGTFTLRWETRCLSRGGATTVFGSPAFATELSSNCSSTDAQWELSPAQAGTFNLRNVEANLLLDVRAGSDVPGAALVLYSANMLDNQRFSLRPRSADTYELPARHAPELCAEARAGELEMWPCDSQTLAQQLTLLREPCP